jgi:hypothetical protein
MFERALKIAEANPPEIDLLAAVRFGLGSALWETGGDRARARSLAKQSREAYAARGETKKKALADVDAWLARHR